MSTLPPVFDEGGRPLALGRLLGSGGEAAVWQLEHQAEKALKLYHPSDAGLADMRTDKLRLMIASPPEDETRRHAHVSLAWPEALAYDDAGRVAGFVMPAIDQRRLVPLHQLLNPRARRERAPGISWRYQVRVARNLCAVLAALHAKGYVLGDLNESNILVSERALVTLVDLDSIQVRSGRRVYRCGVGKLEYTAPELVRRNLREVTRSVQHDRFALAVLLFQLLMEGVHPFIGRYAGEGEPPALAEAIYAGHSPYLRPRSKLEPSRTAPPFALLPGDLRRLFRQALRRRGRRPSPRRWQQALTRLEQRLVPCPANPQHLYARHLPRCPWCQRRAHLGLDAFPAAPGAPFDSARLARSPQGLFDGSFGAFLRRFWTLSSALLLAALLGCYALWQRLEGSARELPFALAGLAVTLVPLAALLWLHRRSRRDPPGYLRLRRGEALLRTLVGASLLTGSLSWLLGRSGAQTDLVLLASLWVFSCGLLWRWLRPKASHP